MKTKVFLFAAMTATVMMTSCNNDDEVIDNNAPVEIRLSSGITAQTRATFPATDTQIANGRAVAIYVDDATTTGNLYGNNVLTANGSGGFTGGTAMYFPQTGNNVDIYAFHTNGTLATAFPTAAISHTVSTDQRVLAGYVASDLLYASRQDVARTTSNVNLTFHHLLSKIQVAVATGNGLLPSDVAKIEILGTLPTAEFTPDKGVNADEQTITVSGIATPIQISLNPCNGFGPEDLLYNDAIIVPQTVATGSNFIQVTLRGGGILTYSLPSETIFESGKKYIYHITANLIGLTVTSTIENWTPVGGVTTGTAVM